MKTTERTKVMTKRTLLGMLTPSSNTTLEPVTSAIVAALPGVSAHFARFPVTEISLGERSQQQFDETRMLDAARSLADAKVDVIAWNGTSSGWLGFERDQRLCERITQATGIPATTSVLALNEIFERRKVSDFALVSPYLTDVQEKIIANYLSAGVNCVAERHLDLHVNFEFSEVTDEQVRTMVMQVAERRPQAITTFCTNLRAAHLAPELEALTGIPVYDTISTVVWKSLSLAGYKIHGDIGWGSLFCEPVYKA